MVVHLKAPQSRQEIRKNSYVKVPDPFIPKLKFLKVNRTGQHFYQQSCKQLGEETYGQVKNETVPLAVCRSPQVAQMT